MDQRHVRLARILKKNRKRVHMSSLAKTIRSADDHQDLDLANYSQVIKLSALLFLSSYS
jgi:hypothetical protein